MLTRLRLAAFPSVVLLAAVLMACGDQDMDKDTDKQQNASAPAHAPVKSSEIPDIVADYVPEKPYKVKEVDGTVFEVAASLLYGNDPAVGSLSVAVVETTADKSAELYRCGVLLSAGAADGCETMQTPDGQVVLSWKRLKSEESTPGTVTVVLKRDRELVTVICQEDGITGDPREQELLIPVDTMLDIARDERLSLD